MKTVKKYAHTIVCVAFGIVAVTAGLLGYSGIQAWCMGMQMGILASLAIDHLKMRL
jgi:uncharacterized membrane protein YtjA (UPF0391 family)